MLQWRTSFRKLKPNFTIVADHAVHTAPKSVTIGLITMTQSRLHDALASLYLLDQSMNVGNHVLVNISDILRNNCTEQHATKTRRWVDRQHDVPQ
jgi:hypothetical protein